MSAALGAQVAIFQWGWGQHLFGIEPVLGKPVIGWSGGHGGSLGVADPAIPGSPRWLPAIPGSSRRPGGSGGPGSQVMSRRARMNDPTAAKANP